MYSRNKASAEEGRRRVFRNIYSSFFFYLYLMLMCTKFLHFLKTRFLGYTPHYHFYITTPPQFPISCLLQRVTRNIFSVWTYFFLLQVIYEGHFIKIRGEQRIGSVSLTKNHPFFFLQKIHFSFIILTNKHFYNIIL